MVKLYNRKTLWFILITIGIIIPFFIDSQSQLLLFTKIYILAVFAMSYDILLGYTGIISFGHAMFFGIGAYSISLMLKHLGESWINVLLAVIIAIFLAAIVSFIVGILTLRLKNTYYAMITLAFAELFQILALKWRSLTNGDDGFNFSSKIPDLLKDRVNFYYLSLLFLVVMTILLYRFVKSPTGKVLVAIKENEQRAENLGYPILHYKLISSIIAGVVASLSGAMYAISYRYVGSNFFGIDKTIDALLMTIIGGVGTLFGSIIGAGIINIAHELLSDLAGLHPIFDRWLILFGILYVLIVMFFPKGIMGSISKYKGLFSNYRKQKTWTKDNSSLK